MKKIGLGLLALVFLVSCATRKAVIPVDTNIGQLKLLGHYNVAHNRPFMGTTIGGLSGIDYDAKNNRFFLICDDRSAINPARFYTVKLALGKAGIDSVQWLSVQSLLQANGKPYPSSKEDPAKTPDPEAIRYDASKNQLVWTSEGERIVRDKEIVLANPAITRMALNGQYIDTLPLPTNLLMHATEKGPRQNGVLEGMTFDIEFKTLYVNVEEPLYEDGPRADVNPNKAWIRIYQYDLKSNKNTAQYAYLLDPVAYPATPATAFKVNGVPDIYAIGNNKLLIMERSFSSGRLPCTIKIFEVDLSGAEDISKNASLIASPPAKPLTKKLLLNMDNLGIYVDNIEGMCFGPTLPNGHKTLVMVADNNFQLFETTQFFLFEIIP
ncbi:MAG: esterase-like activity of phytase family protein [Sediminibacterium sp.]